ncbi:hypothetical protein BDB01DRAFT_795195 [Pilobolus umbonatus]|nr:hypothetical protein BDB01DRAFT_795195 [Pilobolus umbonatus]
MAKSATQKKVIKKEDIVESSSDEESSSNESSAEASSASSNEESEAESSAEEKSSSDEESDEEPEKETRGQKRAVEAEDESPKKVAKVSETAKKVFGESNTIFVGQLDYNATKEDIEEYFKECGNVTDVRLRFDPETRKSRGFAHVDFSTAEEMNAALELDGSEFMGRTLKIDKAKVSAPRAKDENYGPKSDTVFMANLDHGITEDEIREAFSKFGTIVGDVRLPTNRETGKIRGIAYVQFESADEAEEAVHKMNNVSLNGRPIRTDFSNPDDSSRVRGRPTRGRGGGGGFRGNSRGGGGGGFRGNSRGGGRGNGRGNGRGRGNSRF